MRVSLLDYGAGNVCSLRNALRKLGFEVDDVTTPEHIAAAGVLLFPGVGSFGNCMAVLEAKGLIEPLRAYVRADRPFLGICLGMQTLFESSEESPGVRGLGLIPGAVSRFDVADSLSVPQIGWNGVCARKHSPMLDGLKGGDAVYFVHSYRVPITEAVSPWSLCHTTYGETYVSAVGLGRVCAVQFHPEKSGRVGLNMLRGFLEASLAIDPPTAPSAPPPDVSTSAYCKRIVACLDVRANDAGDLVVTKGDQYDVREASEGGAVRNLGKPVALARRYYEEGADEITFLNITAFRDTPLDDMPLQEVLQKSSEQIFVPLCIGGGIRDYTDSEGVEYSALDVASSYFRSGADKVSLGSDAVLIAEEWWNSGGETPGTTPIERISFMYGCQAVVISCDPKRQYVADPAALEPPPGKLPAPTVLKMAAGDEGPEGEGYAWYACTTQGGRETRQLDAIGLAVACEALGAVRRTPISPPSSKCCWILRKED